MVRLNAVVEIFGGSVNHLLFELLGFLQVFNGPRVSLVAIGSDFLRLRIAGLFQGFLKEIIGRWFILSFR